MQYRYRRRLFIIGGVLIVGAALAYIVYEQLSLSLKEHTPTEQTAVSVMDGTNNAKGDTTTNETEKPSLAEYSVAADQPRALYIDALGIAARILPMNLTSQSSIQAPQNVYDAGWYTGSARPGENGAVFIDGHASGATRMGLFAYLDGLKVGDLVTVEMGDGERLTYMVRAVETMPEDTVDMRKVLSPYTTGTQGLNLMTCTGEWIETEKTYDQRVVVYTERV